MSDEIYVQCQIGRGDERRISWIPLDFATVGEIFDFIEVYDEKERYNNKGWKVLNIGKQVPYSYITERGEYCEKIKKPDV